MNLKNSISFSGLENVKVKKKEEKKTISKTGPLGEFITAQRDCVSISLKCDLTDDEKGFDNSAFKNALKKCGNSKQSILVSDTDTDKILLIIKRDEAEEYTDTESSSKLWLNGVPINPQNREILPLYTYLAGLTRKLLHTKNLSTQQSYYVNLANKSISEEAMRFIDNMY